MLVDQLLPPGGPVDIEQVLSDVQLPDDPAAERPHVVGSFISTINGRATRDGVTAPLSPSGGGPDREIFRGLRGVCEAIMVGTGTLREERYGRPGRRRKLREFRAARGFAEEPPVIVVSRSLDLPVDVPFFQDPKTEVLLFTTSTAAPPQAPAQIAVVRMDPAEATLTHVLRTARREHGIRSVVFEGGPTLFGSMITEDLVDDLFLTLAPVYAADDQLPLTASGHAAQPDPMRLSSVLSHDDYLFLRYTRRADVVEGDG